jgi:uncharacterized phage protein gp47/JayE
MIDPGHPFSVPYRDLVTRLEERIREGVEQPASVRFVYQNAVRAYELPKTALNIKRVTGFVEGLANTSVTLFREGTHFKFENNRIVWLSGSAVLPKDGSRFEVEYNYRQRPPGITDFNPGSVIGTLIRAISHETKLIYEQMDVAYRRAFIDHASGVALDNIVALLGVTRNAAVAATGQVTFFKKRAATEDIPLPSGIRASDETGRTYRTTASEVLTTGNSEVTVPIVATQAGTDWNVDAGAIVLMPKPPRGIDGVENRLPVSGGQEPEPDDLLRERAKHELERSGNATLNAIRYAVLDVDGVQGVEVVDHSIDDTIPLGEVRVRFSGGDPNLVARVVEDTRAAGIMARLEILKTIYISGTLYVITEPEVPDNANRAFQSAISNLINTLGIGDPLSIRRLNALVYGITGYADVAESQLTYRKADPGDPDSELSGTVSDPFLIMDTELIRTEPNAIVIEPLSALGVEAVGASVNHYRLTLQVLDSSNLPAEFNAFSLDLNIILRAFLRDAPDQPAERIHSMTMNVAYASASSAQIDIPLEASGFPHGFRPPGETDPHDPERGVEAEIGAAAYPGLQAAVARMEFGG